MLKKFGNPKRKDHLGYVGMDELIISREDISIIVHGGM
jgi:hypothetical protein